MTGRSVEIGTFDFGTPRKRRERNRRGAETRRGFSFYWGWEEGSGSV
jgi:hypothetical protein